MAKKKDKSETNPNPDEGLDYLAKLEKEYGKGFLRNGCDLLEEHKQIVSVSPSFDLALGGGIPEGSFVIFSGKPKTGKTTVALEIAANCQLLNKKVHFFNIEGRLKPMNLRNRNLDAKKLNVIGSTKEKIFSINDYITIAEEIMLSEEGSLLIFDSFSSLMSKKDILEGVDSADMGLTAKLLKGFCKYAGNILPVRNHIIIGITHIISNPGGWGSGEKEQGGIGIAYQADVKATIKKSEEWLENDNPIGKIMNWTIATSALGAPAPVELESYFRYNYGLDETKEIIKMAVDYDIIEKKAAWYKCSFVKDALDFFGETEYDESKWQAQGEEKLYKLIKSNPKLLEYIRKQVII